MKLDVKQVRRLMAAKEFNVKTLAETSGVSYPALKGWLSCGRRPRMDTLGKLARALDVDIYDIAKD